MGCSDEMIRTHRSFVGSQAKSNSSQSLKGRKTQYLRQNSRTEDTKNILAMYYGNDYMLEKFTDKM